MLRTCSEAVLLRSWSLNPQHDPGVCCNMMRSVTVEMKLYPSPAVINLFALLIERKHWLLSCPLLNPQHDPAVCCNMMRSVRMEMKLYPSPSVINLFALLIERKHWLLGCPLLNLPAMPVQILLHFYILSFR